MDHQHRLLKHELTAFIDGYFRHGAPSATLSPRPMPTGGGKIDRAHTATVTAMAP